MKSEKCKTKWYHKKILCIPIWAVGFAVLVAAAGYAQQQTLQLTTYYPAPYGEYTQMRVAEKLEILSPKGKLQVTKGAGISRTGLDIDLNRGEEAVQLSKFSDINNTNYSVDPNSVSKISQLLVVGNSGNGQTSRIDFGGVPFEGWPFRAQSADYGASGSTSLMMCYGTSQTVKVSLPYKFAKADYFVMISPRQLYSPYGIPEHTHRQSPRFPNRRTYSNGGHTVNFNYYRIANIEKSETSFKVVFEGTDPKVFDWLVIGKITPTGGGIIVPPPLAPAPAPSPTPEPEPDPDEEF